ncbi:putative glucose receptor git3 protein [Botryosphaeria dothidea]|uniref:Glucose receptor git3 protein n=1 Tax=Botryosphaeria dothidea TaxID=55169 RepID=A0A8H4INX4_9PEZI|nr:putative glucose receptor git3 protein [Botryosphaeria dothidea]
MLSFVASSIVITLWCVFGGQRRSFRYALILNLTVAEFINSLNNTISGLYIVINHGVVQDGSACDLNGWVGQFSVQAVDFSILAIAVITLLTIQFKKYILYASTTKKILICASTWVVPLITSSTALGIHAIKPVSGNWCWIGNDRKWLRYALGHGWRFAIIIITFCIYIYVFSYMHQRLRMRDTSGRSYSFDYGNDSNGFEMNFWLANNGPVNGRTGPGAGKADDDFPLPPPKAFSGKAKEEKEGEEKLIPAPRIRIRQTNNIDKDVWRMVLLNMYPSSTQYIGFANACVYGFKEHWVDVKAWWRGRTGGGVRQGGWVMVA